MYPGEALGGGRGDGEFADVDAAGKDRARRGADCAEGPVATGHRLRRVRPRLLERERGRRLIGRGRRGARAVASRHGKRPCRGIAGGRIHRRREPELEVSDVGESLARAVVEDGEGEDVGGRRERLAVQVGRRLPVLVRVRVAPHAEPLDRHRLVGARPGPDVLRPGPRPGLRHVVAPDLDPAGRRGRLDVRLVVEDRELAVIVDEAEPDLAGHLPSGERGRRANGPRGRVEHAGLVGTAAAGRVVEIKVATAKRDRVEDGPA